MNSSRRGGNAGLLVAAVVACAIGVVAGYVTRSDREANEADVVPDETRAVAANETHAARSRPTKVVIRGRRPPSNPLLDPDSIDYSPATAATALDLDVGMVFASERRDPAFADRRERFLQEHFAAVLRRHGPGVEVLGIECRTGSCRAVFEAPDDGWSPKLVSIVAWGKLTSTDEVSREGGRITYEVTTLMDRELRDHTIYERYLTDWRSKMERDLDLLRSQHVPAN